MYVIFVPPFPQTFWFSCLNTVLVSNRNIFVLYLSSLQGTKFIGFVGMRCRGKKTNPQHAPSSNKQLLKMGVFNPRGKRTARVLTSPLTSG